MRRDDFAKPVSSDAAAAFCVEAASGENRVAQAKANALPLSSSESEDLPLMQDLPLMIVDRSQRSQESAKLSRAKPSSSRWRPAARVLRFLPFLILLPIGAVAGLYFQPPGAQKNVARAFNILPDNSARTALAPKKRVIVGLGKLVPLGEVLTIAPPYGASDARIAALNVVEGQRVVKGAVLAILDNEGPLKAALASASANVAARKAAFEQSLASVAASRNEARATLARSQATLENLQRDLERSEALFKKGHSSEAIFFQKRTARDEMQREIDRAQATLSRYDSADPMKQPDVLAALRNVNAAEADFARAERDMEKASVLSPIDGAVLALAARAGEKPGAAGILRLGDIDHMTTEVEVYQSHIGAVAIGDAVTVTNEALPEPLKGAVTRIGLEVGRQVITDASPAANTDARVVKVYVGLEPASSKIAARFTGLQVLARIESQPEIIAGDTSLKASKDAALSAR